MKKPKLTWVSTESHVLYDGGRAVGEVKSARRGWRWELRSGTHYGQSERIDAAKRALLRSYEDAEDFARRARRK